MKEQIYLKDLAFYLGKTHIKLNLLFLNKLLKDASKSDKPYRNEEFAKRIKEMPSAKYQLAVKTILAKKDAQEKPLTRIERAILDMRRGKN